MTNDRVCETEEGITQNTSGPSARSTEWCQTGRHSKEKENDENQIVHHLSAPSAKFANKYAMTIWKRMDRK